MQRLQHLFRMGFRDAQEGAGGAFGAAEALFSVLTRGLMLQSGGCWWWVDLNQSIPHWINGVDAGVRIKVLPVYGGCNLGGSDTVVPAHSGRLSPGEAKAVSAFGFASLCHRTPCIGCS
jgi:hypothetical protein